MVTGDSLSTGVSIAKEVGIIDNEGDASITSNELNKLSNEEVKKLIPRLRVVARALPEDKKKD